MNPAVVARAVLTRLQADTSLYSGGAWTSLLAGGASFNKANPQGLAYPFLVFSVDWNAENAFNGLFGPITITIQIHDTDGSGTSNLEQIIDRLIGDSMLSSGSKNTPTYGFHNHQLALPAIGSTNIQGAKSSSLDFSSASIAPSDTPNVNQATLTFTGQTSNEAANL